MSARCRGTRVVLVCGQFPWRNMGKPRTPLVEERSPMLRLLWGRMGKRGFTPVSDVRGGPGTFGEKSSSGKKVFPGRK